MERVFILCLFCISACKRPKQKLIVEFNPINKTELPSGTFNELKMGNTAVINAVSIQNIGFDSVFLAVNTTASGQKWIPFSGWSAFRDGNEINTGALYNSPSSIITLAKGRQVQLLYPGYYYNLKDTLYEYRFSCKVDSFGVQYIKLFNFQTVEK